MQNEIEVYISALKITGEDPWMLDWIEKTKGHVERSPQYLYLKGNFDPMAKWMKARKLPRTYVSKKLMLVLKSIIRYGQKEPIKIYEDMRINTGHKRVACLLFLGYKKVKAQFVSDNYKL